MGMMVCGGLRIGGFIRRTLAGFAAALILISAGCSEDQVIISDPEDTREAGLIEPGKAVGGIRIGMTVRDVIEAFGEPDRRTSNALEYLKRGFAVMPDAQGVVRVVMCGDVTGLGGPLVKRFAARTTSGIGMGSTREEVLRVFGQPTVEETHMGSRESLDYRELGVTFSIEQGKVHHIIVRLGEEYQPTTAIEVDHEQ
jgi:outer membrane protein assembly factor BamE (lipoprotein component of BamABCDE complex)